MVQDGTGTRTATWPGTVTWIAGQPTWNTAAGKVNFANFFWDGTTYWGSGIAAT
jgi:hypothetical protein